MHKNRTETLQELNLYISYLSFHVDKFHLKPKTKKDLDISQKIPTFIKISKNTGEKEIEFNSRFYYFT
jgi:hypothetical protein